MNNAQRIDRRSTGAHLETESEAFQVSVQLELAGYVELGRKLATVEKYIIKLEDEWEASTSLSSTARMKHRERWERKKRRLEKQRARLLAQAAEVLQ